MNQGETNTQKVLKGISSQTVVTIVLGVVEIVSFSIMSRLLTREDFGYYAAITAITSIFSAFSETGIGSAIIQRKELNQRFVDNAFTINLFLGSFLTLLLFVLSGPLSKMVVNSSMKGPLMLISMTLLFHCLTSVNISLMKRKLQFLRIGLINLTAQIIAIMIAIILAIKGFGYYAILTKVILSGIIVLILSYFMANTKYKIALDKDYVKAIFSFSGWLMASTVLRNLAHQIDRLLLPRLISVEALGEYNRPNEFVRNISSRLNGIFDTALFPVLSCIQDDKKKLATAFRRSFYNLNIFATLLTLAFIFNSELIIRVFFGSKWLDLNHLMMTVAATLLFNIDGRLADCYLRSLGMTKQQFIFRVAETIITSLSVIAGFRWGVMGVALTVFATNMLVKLFKVTYIAHKINISITETFALLVSSWRFSAFVIPPALLSLLLTDHTIYGNCIILTVFVITCILVFIVFPKSVGKKYEEETYHQIISFINSKVYKK